MTTPDIKDILDFDDAGASDDHPAKGVTVGHIRAWYDQYEELRVKLAVATGDFAAPSPS